MVKLALGRARRLAVQERLAWPTREEGVYKALLGPEARLGWALAIASVSLASAQFIEPVLFGRIVDNLAGKDLASVYRSLVDVLPLPPDQEREEVYQMFLGRESRLRGAGLQAREARPTRALSSIYRDCNRSSACRSSSEDTP